MALRLDEVLLHLSRERRDSAGLVLGHASSGRNLVFVGKLALSRFHLEESLALHDPISHRSLVHQAGFELSSSSQAFLGIVLFCLGYPDQASARSGAAIAEARRLAHPPSLAQSLAFGARLLSLVGDNTALGTLAEELITVATEQGFPFYRAQGTIYRGWVTIQNGDATQGMALLQSGLNAYRSTGAETWIPHFIDLLAGAYEIAGQTEDALTLLDEALQIVERSGERWLSAELNRHRGRLLLRQGNIAGATELYRRALDITEEQGAKLWELRAAISLARLHRDQGRHSEARDLLTGVHSWFSEGFGTPDLKGAKALLDELT